VQSDASTVTVTGSVLVYGLTGSPANVEVTFEAADGCLNNNSASDDADVYDDIDPVIACPNDTTFECDAIGYFGYPTATDNCDANPTITLFDRDSIPGDCPQEYQLVLTYEATDDAGNSDYCQQTITIEDTTDPEISCPDTLEFVFQSPTRAAVLFEITATDNCADTLEIMSDSASGSVFVIGEHTISSSVDDGCGNTDTCSFSFRLVPFDVKPGSCPNAFNVKFQGPQAAMTADPTVFGESVLPVAILGTDDLDVKQIDVESLRLEGVAPLRFSYEDVATPVADDPGPSCVCTREGRDGYLDLTLKFSRSEIVSAISPVFDGDEVMLTITGAMSDGTLLAGGDCVLIRGPKAIPIGSETANIPEEGGFEAWCYPNPFNPETNISYRLPEAGEVSLIVYNVMGQEVARLVDRYQAAGLYTVRWTGRDDSGVQVASGIYFYRLQAGEFGLTRKMMLLK
jgi:hypothetical protein